MFLTSVSQPIQFPKFDLTISISVILALCAIISPIFTALINNAHHIRIRKMELEQEHFRETVLHQDQLFENYLKYAGRCINNADPDAMKDYGEYYFSALSYASGELRSSMIKANNLMSQLEYEKAVPVLEEITTMISNIRSIK